MSILKTPDAKSVYKEILEIIKKYIITKRAKENFSINLFSDAKDILAMQDKILKYSEIDETIIDKIRENLIDFELKKQCDFFVDRTIVVSDNESYEKFLYLKKYCNLMYYNEVDENQHVVIADSKTSLEDLLPELFIINFVVNKETLRKIFNIYSLLQQNNVKIEVERLNEILALIENLNEKCELNTEEINKKKVLIKNFRSIIHEYKEKINLEILKEVEKRNIKIDAKELLMKGVNSISQIPEINEAIKTITEKSITEISEKFCINKPFLSSIFEQEYPITIDEDEAEKFLKEINREILETEYEYKVKVAKKLIKFEVIEQLCEEIYSLDEILGIVKFAKDKKATMPNISNILFFKGGRNLLLNDQTAITYSLGGEIEKRKISMLTGANSGGKTTLLKTILQIQIMAQSGLPVCAEVCEFPIVDEIYFLGKHTGTLSAGAFESTLKTIAKILISKNKKIVLIDELEAITEPGAAAKMISAIFEILIENDDFAVIVTHLGDEILKYMNKDVRVDGIEATGLDENLNLIVDRQPKFNKIGKSTPELIIERLYRLTNADNRKRDECEIYRRIFEKIRSS